MARIKPKGRDVVYHCVSRVVGGQFLLKDIEKEHFRRLMWAQAEFCGVEIVGYCIMSNHFHLLVKVPGVSRCDDKEIVARVSKFYGAKHPVTKRLLCVCSNEGSIPDEMKDRLLSRMGDLSVFLKELKQRFSAWYNRQHGRFGTLWAERFRSTLVEGIAHTMLIVSAYIDLNPVRAGIVKDPRDYRFCGYAEAIVGSKRCRAGIMSFHPPGDWRQVSALYREYLFIKGGFSGHVDKATMDRESILGEIKKGAVLSPAQLLRLRIRYFSDGVVLGSRGYVNELFLEYQNRFGKKRETGARALNSALKALGFTAMRDLRHTPFS
ncbi:MAG: transposase [Verrucomicrobia bacterium]|nr:transposase [Verrucomicrobiota bacterium]